MLKIALCDDDAAVLENIEACVLGCFSKTTQRAEVKTFTKSEHLAASIADGDRFDLYILDVEMPELNGFEVARKLRVYQPDAGIIFLTSHFEFADEGYKVRALRYVQKLKYQQDLPEALSEACLSLERADTKSLAVLHYGNLTRVLFRDIVYIQKAHRSLSVYTTEQGMIQDNRGLKELYGVLNDSRFIFTDRSYLVNIDFARQIEGYWMILKGGKKVPISRPMMPSVKQAIIRLCEG